MSHNQPKSIVSNNQSTTAPRVANQKKPIPGPLVVEHTEESRTDVQEEEEEEQPQPQSITTCFRAVSNRRETCWRKRES